MSGACRCWNPAIEIRKKKKKSNVKGSRERSHKLLFFCHFPARCRGSAVLKLVRVMLADTRGRAFPHGLCGFVMQHLPSMADVAHAELAWLSGWLMAVELRD